MTGKLKDYQVLDVLCGGTFYKVQHKVTNKIFAWKAYNCSAYSDEEVEAIASDVKAVSRAPAHNLLRYYDTILHAPSRTLYFVLEYNSWRSLDELASLCQDSDRYIAESFLWYLLHELAGVSAAVVRLDLKVLLKCITLKSIFVDESGELRVNCFNLSREEAAEADVVRQVGRVMHALCYRTSTDSVKIKEFHYSDDLQDVVTFLTDERNANLRPDVVLYHPTVLANLETLSGPKNLSEIMIPMDSCDSISEVNKCDSVKAVELCKSVEPAPRSRATVYESPIYSNISPKRAIEAPEPRVCEDRGSLSPTIAALALELPGFVPRSRRAISQAVALCGSPQRVTEQTLSQQWMSRLIALRQREESLNQRERDLIAKEIVNSPAAKVIPLNDKQDEQFNEGNSANGITLPPMISAHLPKEEPKNWASRRHRRSNSVKTRKVRKSYAYEDLDSSLSADQGDGSIIVTAAKITKENMPRRNIFPEVSSKKVHFTSANPFAESDESVTLTFYELENVDGAGYQVPRKEEKVLNDITKFKYLDLEKVTSEKRAALQQWHSSPSKQAKITKNVFADITNSNEAGVKRTPSKTSLVSKASNTSNGSHYSTASSKSQWSMASAWSKMSEGSISNRTRASMRQSLAPIVVPATEKKPKSRKSLLPFKTPFKFMSSTKS